MLQVGQRAPNFELPGASAGQIDDHALEEYVENDWAVVVVFYPFDFHPTCTTQLCLLRDAEDLSLLEETVVLGVSTDSVYSHRAYSEEYRIDFPLLSDADGRVTRAYGVLADEVDGHRGVAQPSLFVVGPDRRIRYAWRSDDPEAVPDMSAVVGATLVVGGSSERSDRTTSS